MGWRIHSWDASTATGEVVSSHFGPWPFEGGPHDFVAGEDVLVDLEGDPKAYRVRNVRPARQRQPEGTRHPVLDGINERRHEDCFVEEKTADSWKLWLGDCCAWCGPSIHVTFRDVKLLKGDEVDLDLPWFRLATVDERRDHALVVEGDAQAYCIVTNHGYGPDGPLVFVVAGAIDITPVERG